MPKDRSTHHTRAEKPTETPAHNIIAPVQPGFGTASPAQRINLASLFLKLLPGFLPLLVYVLAESIWGETIGLSVAIAFGVIEFIWILVREGRPDWLSAMDTILLVMMGGISLAFNAPVFIRIKPALVELLMAVLLGISAFGTRNLVMGRMLRDLKGSGLMNEAAEARMAGTLAGMFWLVLFHCVLTVIAAIWMSEAVWLFVSGGLLYILMAVWMAGMLVRTFWQKRHPSGF